MKALFSITKISIRELLYERVFYILLAFSACTMAISFLIGQLTYADKEKLTVDFVFAGIEVSMVLFSVFMGISLFQRELTLGTVAMVLSKPISRGSFLIGKFLGQLFVQVGLIALLSLLVLIIGGAAGVEAVLQNFIATSLKISILTALTYFFAVNTGAILSAMTSLLIYSLGHFVENVTTSIKDPVHLVFWKFIQFFVPAFESLNLKNLASYNILLPWGEIAILTVYALLMTGVYLSLAVFCFNERDILT